jgi:uncharacterized protein (TIGR03437 family)
VLRRLIIVAFGLSFAALEGFAQGPVISPGGTVNGASFAAGQPVAPGSLVSVFGSNFASGLSGADTIPLSTTLGGVSVTFNGVQAPMLLQTQGQLNVQVPFNVLPAGQNGSVNVIVSVGGVPSAADPVTINQYGPAIFTIGTHAVALIETTNDPRDGTVAAAPGSIAGATTNFAHPGDVLTVYATGMGPLDGPVANGDKGGFTPLKNTTTIPTILFNQVPGQVLFSGLSPEFVGVYQINVVVPAVGSGTIPLQIQMGGVTSPASVTVAVGP